MKYEPFQDSLRKSFGPVKVVRMKAHKKLSTDVTVIALSVTSLTPSMHEDEFHFRLTDDTYLRRQGAQDGGPLLEGVEVNGCKAWDEKACHDDVFIISYLI